MVARPVRHVWITATTGAGKTTLARALGQRWHIAHIELDALYWEPGWQPAELEVFRQRVMHALRAPGWIVDGNYSAVRDLYLPQTDLVIWLDYGFWRNLSRLLGRTVRRVGRAEPLWAGNREHLSKVLSRDSILLWFFQTYWRRRRELPQLLDEMAAQGVLVARLHTPAALEAWLSSFPVSLAPAPSACSGDAW
ncbi:hypothetical protein ACUHMQ_06530 [Chitinimonas sp. PSY-7]|uniref:hypothetical protein n=1 Tax=Chitinimonas sp. PSY-7 TaxID=3459088 RepID=UPI0040400AE6